MGDGNKSKPIIGLLGAPGSGKSWVAGQFASLGCGVIDADVIAKEALDEPAIRDELIQWWGAGVLSGDGRVDREAVGRIVFADAAELDRLEGLVHPRVDARRGELRQRYRHDPAIAAIVEDVPLLMEAGLDGDCDVLLFVEASEAVRLKRVARERDWSASDLAAREKNQMPLDIKRQKADYVISNDADAEETAEQVRRVFSLISQTRVE